MPNELARFKNSVNKTTKKLLKLQKTYIIDLVFSISFSCFFSLFPLSFFLSFICLYSRKYVKFGFLTGWIADIFVWYLLMPNEPSQIKTSIHETTKKLLKYSSLVPLFSPFFFLFF